MEYLANEFVEIVRAPKDKKIFAFTPAICVLESGRYVFSGDFGGKEIEDLPEYASITPSPAGKRKLGHIYTSDDKGATWRGALSAILATRAPSRRAIASMCWGRVGDLVIYRSTDDGDTWDEGHWLTSGESWHQSACSYWIEDGYITLVMEQSIILPNEYTSGWNGRQPRAGCPSREADR